MANRTTCGNLALAFEWVTHPEMASARDHEAAHIDTGLVERVLERLGLGGWINNVVGRAVNDQEPGAAAIGRGVAHRRGVEIDPPVLHRRCTEIFLRDLVARARELVVLPLRQHVVYAVDGDHHLNVGRHSIIGVAAVLGSELVSCEPHEGGEMSPGGIAHQADALWIDSEIGRLSRTNWTADFTS